MDKARAVGWMLAAASGKSVHIDRTLAEELRSTLADLMDHWHPDPDGADYRCELCGNSPRSVWDAEAGRYRQMPTEHESDCLGDRAVKALDIALDT